MQYMQILSVNLLYKAEGWLKEQFVLYFSDCIENLPKDSDLAYTNYMQSMQFLCLNLCHVDKAG